MGTSPEKTKIFRITVYTNQCGKWSACFTPKRLLY